MLNGVKQLTKHYSNRLAVTTGKTLRSTQEDDKTPNVLLTRSILLTATFIGLR